MFRHRRNAFIAGLVVVVLAGCEGARNNSSWSTAKPGDAIVPPLDSALRTAESESAPAAPSAAGTAAATTGAAPGRGVGPVDHVDIAALDGARALKGSQLFPVKCSACHKLDERYIGPALAGVTTRRQPEWILNMILNPENMLQQDPTAKALLVEFIAPMANQHLTREEAEDILAFFLQHDAGRSAAPSESQAAGSTQPAQPATQ